MIKKITTAFIFSSVLVTASPINQYRGEYSQAMGQSGVASQPGINAMHINPALLANYETWEVTTKFLSLGLNHSLVDYAEWAIDNSDNFDEMEKLVEAMDPIDNKWAPFLTHAGLGFRLKQLAFDFSWNTYTELAVTKAPLTPILGVGANSNFQLAIGYGHDFKNDYQVGMTIHTRYDIKYKTRYIGTLSEDFYTVKEAIEEETSSTWDDVRKIRVAEEIADVSLKAGASIGAAKKLNDQFTVGGSFLSIPNDEMSVNIGGSWQYALGDKKGIHTMLTLNADWQNMFRSDHDYFQQFNFGASSQLQNGARRIGYLATGVHDGYPTFGLQVGYFVYLSYTYYVEEIGTYPGQNPLSFHKVSLDMNI